MVKKKPSDLIFEKSLQNYFYKELLELNTHSTPRLPLEAIHYSSLVMEQFENSENYFEKSEGKLREKILGVKLLEIQNMPLTQAKRSLKDVGDTALFLCGFFSESLNRKIIDEKYYHDLGKMAYDQLDSLDPPLYKLISTNFDLLTILMSIVSKKSKLSNESNNYFLISTKKGDGDWES
ncbi:MAG: hypothetical protein ACHQYQ_09615 [Bacteriovoracales bacterium]